MSTNKPVKQSNKIQIGDKVFCTHAASPWFVKNKVYEVEPHPKTEVASVKASDGCYDMLSLCSSKFQKMEDDQHIIDIAPTEQTKKV